MTQREFFLKTIIAFVESGKLTDSVGHLCVDLIIEQSENLVDRIMDKNPEYFDDFNNHKSDEAMEIREVRLMLKDIRDRMDY